MHESLPVKIPPHSFVGTIARFSIQKHSSLRNLFLIPQEKISQGNLQMDFPVLQ